MRNLLLPIASLLFFLPAVASVKINGGKPSAHVSTDQPPYAFINVVDLRDASTWRVSTQVFRFHSERTIGQDLGRIEFILPEKSILLTPSRTISVWNHRDGLMVYETLLALATENNVTLYLVKPSVQDSTYSKGYGVYDIKVSLNGEKAVDLSLLVAAYRKQQEREHGRYYGLGGRLRKAARRLIGTPVKFCSTLFERR